MQAPPPAFNGLAPRGRQRHVDYRMTDISSIEWRVSNDPIPYPAALAEMTDRATAIRDCTASELVWLLEHPPLFTAGTSADPAELFNPLGVPVYEAGRGGRYTYHGPGQRVVYLMLDLDRRGRDLRRYVSGLESWMIATLADLGVEARRECGRIGIWTGSGADEAKIGAIGVRVKRWVTMHGLSINLAPDLSHFSGIVPCGLAEFGVTSLAALGKNVSFSTLDAALERSFPLFVRGLSDNYILA